MISFPLSTEKEEKFTHKLQHIPSSFLLCPPSLFFSLPSRHTIFGPTMRLFFSPLPILVVRSAEGG